MVSTPRVSLEFVLLKADALAHLSALSLILSVVFSVTLSVALSVTFSVALSVTFLIIRQATFSLMLGAVFSLMLLVTLFLPLPLIVTGVSEVIFEYAICSFKNAKRKFCFNNSSEKYLVTRCSKTELKAELS